MRELGYTRYVVSGGDVGGDVAEQLAAMHPDEISAPHLTNASPLHAVFVDPSATYEDLRAAIELGHSGRTSRRARSSRG